MTVTIPSRITIGVLALQGAFHEHLHCLQRLRIDGVDIVAIPVRTTAELEACAALIIPGGESTVISRLAARTPGLLPALQAFVADPARAVWGTCAGMILLADEIGGGRGGHRAVAEAGAGAAGAAGGGRGGESGEVVRGWGGIRGLRVWRNLYGGQLESFEYPLEIPAIPGPPFPATFIRAPAVHSLVVNKTDAADVQLEPVEIVASLPPHVLPAPPPADTPLGAPDPALLGAVMLRQGRKLVCAFHPELSGDPRVCTYWVERCVIGRTGT
ncbi:Senecionine N-oxygenase [Cryptotrichosporon argae]